MRHSTIVLLAGMFLPAFLLPVHSAHAQPQNDQNGDMQYVQVSEDALRAKLYYNEGVRQQNLGNIEQAVRQFQTSLTYNSLFVPSHERLQDIFFMQGKEDSMRVEYENLKNAHPDNAVYTYLAARLLDVEDAETEFSRVVQLDPFFYWGYFGLGQNYLTRGLFDEAVEQFRKAVEINPVIPEAQLALGIAYENLGKWEMAQKQYQMALLINPGVVPEAHFHLGMLYVEHADITQSLEHLKQYLDLVKEGSQVELAQAQVDSIEANIAREAMLEELEKLEKEDTKKKKGTAGGAGIE